MDVTSSEQDDRWVDFNSTLPLARFEATLPLVLTEVGHSKWSGDITVSYADTNQARLCFSDEQWESTCYYDWHRKLWTCCTPEVFSTSTQTVNLTVEWFASYGASGCGYVLNTDPVLSGEMFDFLEPTFIPVELASQFFDDHTLVWASSDPALDWYARDTYREQRKFAINFVDLDIDSNNDNGFAPPDRSLTEDTVEDDATRPGKIVLVNRIDDDEDDVPGFADALEEFWQGSGGSLAWFVPITLDLTRANSGNLTVQINFTYAASDPGGVVKEPGPGDELGTKYKPDPSGHLRLWMKDGDQRRSVLTIPQGDYVSPGWHALSDLNAAIQEDGTIRLFLEAIRPSEAQGSDRILVQVRIQDSMGLIIYEGEDAVRVTAIDVDMLDLRAWGPTMNGDGSAGIANVDLDAVIENSEVGGAITDGASICLLRVVPVVDFQLAGVQASVEVRRGDTVSANPQIVGTVHAPTYTFAGVQLPPLPEPYPPPIEHVICDFNNGKAFYIPPESYVDPQYGSPEQSLNALETCLMCFNLYLDAPNGGGGLLGRIPFVLRRPPIVLVHGIMSSPATWSSSEWSEQAGAPVPTRIYYADWSQDATKGFGENFGKVAIAIEHALVDYRMANDNGHAENRGFRGIRYAATRADVVAHSQGGALTRFYIADDLPALVDRVGWIADLQNTRAESSPVGHWPFLRNDNFGAGCIRRFVSIGTPFRGSPLANAASSVFAPGDASKPPSASFIALTAWYNSGDMPAALSGLLFTAAAGGTYVEPTCVADLSQDSDAQMALQNATYPGSYKSVRWFPAVGIATDNPGNAPMQSVLWELLFTFVPLIPNDPTEVSPLSPANSDLVVPALSQRNAAAGVHPNSNAGEEFEYTAHSAVSGILPGETEQITISTRVGELLSRLPSPFNLSWTLKQ